MRIYRAGSWSVVVVLVLIMFTGCAHPPVQDAVTTSKFVAIPLGTKGGLNEADLSSYLLAPAGGSDFIALDAGTLMAGLHQAAQCGSFQQIAVPADSPLSLEGWVLQNHLKAYLISHAHLDHVAGLVINSPDDSKKNILGLPTTIDYLRDHLFNWNVWPNMGDEGEGFHLKKYHYVRLTPGESHAIANTSMTVVPFTLSHSGDYESTAFLIEADGNYVVYFGDTGPDQVEKSEEMHQVWEAIAPLIRQQKLQGIFLEVSYPSARPDKLLFGHLTPKWMLEELHDLAELVDPDQPETALQGLDVVVTHIKPTLTRADDPAATIMRELTELNDLGVTFILPESGKRILF